MLLRDDRELATVRSDLDMRASEASERLTDTRNLGVDERVRGPGDAVLLRMLEGRPPRARPKSEMTCDKIY